MICNCGQSKVVNESPIYKRKLRGLEFMPPNIQMCLPHLFVFSFCRTSLKCGLPRCLMSLRASLSFLPHLLHFTTLLLLSPSPLWPTSPRLQTVPVTHPLSLSLPQMTLKRREPRGWLSSRNRSVIREGSQWE